MDAGPSSTFPLWAWLVFVGIVLALLVLDLFVFHREAKEVPFGEALWLSAFIWQLRGRANWHRIAREWMYEDEPQTELGRQEAEFYAGASA